jgi:hypothetical protein
VDKDLAGGSGHRGGVVDAADLGEPLAVTLLAFGQAGGQLVAGGGLGGRRPQRLGSHHHALAVTRQHQHVAGLAGRLGPGGVEAVEVDRGALGELLDLPVAQPLPGGPLDRPGRLGERAARALHRRQPPQPMGVALCGQVQRPIGGVQVGVAAGTVGQALHAHVPEHRRQRARPPGLDTVARHLVGVQDPGQLRLPRGAEVHVVLEQLAHQIPAGGLEMVLQLPVGQPRRLLTVQPRHHRLKARTRGAERCGWRFQRIGFHSGSFSTFRSDNKERSRKEPLLLAVTTPTGPHQRLQSP